MSNNLNPDKALIFRITHRDNVPWLLENGLHCQQSELVDPNFIQIGNPELIEKRRTRPVPIPPGGTLGDYIPFYFTPFSPMMYNIYTGHNGIRQRSNDEIVIVVTSLHKLRADEIDFIFTDRHANLNAATFSSDLEDLALIDWKILQNRDFKRDPNDLGKLERYQAEALIHQHLPIGSLLGLVCCDSKTKAQIEAEAEERGADLKIVAKRSWFF